jgi:hypothetical protein
VQSIHKPQQQLSNVFIGTEANRSVSDNGAYVAFVQLAVQDYEVFKAFRASPVYRVVLEHVSQELGEKYMEIIKNDSPEFMHLFDAFKDNDIVGAPERFNYSDVGPISPTTLRYVKVASDMRKLFGNVIGRRIAEVGAGYGGQLLIYDKVFGYEEYHLFDLPPVLSLVSKYLESHVLNGSYKLTTLNQQSGNEVYDLVVSNYAFSELPSKLQRKYIEKIMSKSKRGYLTMNSGFIDSACATDKLSVDELRSQLPQFEIIPENPLTHPRNFVIVWGH